MKTCGDIQAHQMICICSCGLVRQLGKPHAYFTNLQIKGWFCDCGQFNEEEKDGNVLHVCHNSKDLRVEKENWHEAGYHTGLKSVRYDIKQIL